MSQSIIQLLLIDDDPIFRIGIRSICERFSDLEVVAEAETATRAREVLDGWAQSDAIAPPEAAPNAVKIALLELGVKDLSTHPDRAIAFCRQFQIRYRDIPLLLITTVSDPDELSAAREAGVAGYCPKGVALEELLGAIREVAAGGRYWVDPLPTTPPGTRPPRPAPPTRWQKLRFALIAPGLRDIETALEELGADLEQAGPMPTRGAVPMLNWLITRGRYRELRAARRLVSHLLPESPEVSGSGGGSPPPESATGPSQPRGELVQAGRSDLAVPGEADLGALRSLLFDATVAKLQSGLVNQTGIPLEIDLLKLSKKQELIYTILRKFEDLLDELQLSEIEPDRLILKCPALLRDLWAGAVADFYGKYYTLSVGDRQVEAIPVLLRDAPLVEAAILNRIPLMDDLLAHLLFGESLTIDNQVYPPGSLEATRRAQALLQHGAIQIANGVIQPLLNRFADLEEVKQTFYDRRMLSTREIEKFRNNLSWRYRVDRYVSEPKAIFESTYTLFVLGERGIQKRTIYASRRRELESLSGVPLAVTLVLEGRDAIAPRVRTAVSFVGSGVVFVLTQVLGRGLGLIGRGILQGIGSSIQDSPVKKK
ncbi:DUF3685 domain-containing protein [Lyngbya sp. CCY1209]|uniref:DUF3685 domain-containing protein n=1 Tax=Lyngbya sp. CCY1209 TaxID=2886103 RepID=UPI002D2107D6|nr:DUF3685 domain-containing protein [Lyngbya sp. CCY1209]MEB3882949.1 DUF3685 domain-containing protein [Lyngbya sp. CCY1209]